MKKIFFFTCLVISVHVSVDSSNVKSDDYFPTTIYADDGEEWIDLSVRGKAESLNVVPKFRNISFVMGDEESERIINSQDYFSTLKFDSNGNLSESQSINLDDVLKDQEYFTVTWEREKAEQIYFESRELSTAGKRSEALNLLNEYKPSLTEQKAKLNYMKVQDLIVILRGVLSVSDREKYEAQLRLSATELRKYLNQLNTDDRDLVEGLLMHAEVELQESQKKLDQYKNLSVQSSKVIQPSPPIYVSPEVPQTKVPAITIAPKITRTPSPRTNSQHHNNPSISRIADVNTPPSSSKARLSDRNPIMKLKITSAKDIGKSEAETILKGIGLMTSKRGFQKSLQGLYKGYTYRSNPNARLDNQMRDFLFKEYRLLRKALEKYSDKPSISQKATPQLYKQWMQKASLELTALGSQRERYALLKSLMTQESGRTHWRNFVPVMGYTADIGFGQFLPATAKSVGINPYDPEENMRGIAIYLNRLIKKKGIRNGLASYNGGNSPPPRSFRYADSIMSRLA